MKPASGSIRCGAGGRRLPHEFDHGPEECVPDDMKTGSSAMALPLAGLRIIEIAGIGPGPFCGMMLADHGAEVIRIDRPAGQATGPEVDGRKDVLLRSRRTVTVDLKTPEGAAFIRDLARTADGLFEGFRPGVMERLGLGPDILCADNPGLVYGRMTGWGQDGPYATLPGHDINYIALSGVLDAIGRNGQKPTPPLNLVGDFGGGGLMLAFGMVSAMLAAKASRQGRVIDCAMTEGASLLMSGIWSMKATGQWGGPRGTNMLDSGAPFYETYETCDGRYVALGAIEPKFYAKLLEIVGFDGDPEFVRQMDPAKWPLLKDKLSARFRERSLAEWCVLLEGHEACFAPVMSMDDAPSHPHNQSRQSYLTVDGMIQPAPAPRYSDTTESNPVMWCADNAADELFDELRYSEERRMRLRLGGMAVSR